MATQVWALIRRGLSRTALQWRRSLQFRTVVSTLLLTALAFAAVGAFLSNQIATGLYEERFEQFRAESSNGLTEVEAIFSSASTTDRESTSQLVRDTLPSLEGGGADAPRRYVLAIVPGQTTDVYMAPFGSDGLLESSAIPQTMVDAVRNGDDQYWSATSIKSDTGERVPGLAFGTKVTLPPAQTEYALYLIYDLSSMQATLDYIHGVIWIAGTLLLVTIGAIAWFVTRSVVGPVSHAAVVSEKLASGHLQERMDVKGEDEVARLGASFNHMAESLQDQITQLAQLSQMQQRFVSDVSHELRTPLTTVRMAAEVLHDARANFDPINRRSAEILYNQVERFQALLADLLEISRFDAGAAVLEPESIDIFQVVRHVIDGAQPLADACGSELTIISRETECIVEADPRRIDRILRNLVVNALEHGDGKPVVIYIASNPDAVAVAVRDYGIGMTPLEASRVFDRFWRADPARARTTGGSGLGLSIATEDAHLHGAWLQAWGSPGKGACFRLTLPKLRDSVLKVSPLPLPPRKGGVPERPPVGTTPESLPQLQTMVKESFDAR
ncbi:sensor histidine kinase [Arthrobacter sp. AET 35A]|uniref:MtrAB system histidine kinase MtrB n=1 Tax=unclassified Arthrobacter TaxID=235627 RepID=UPI001492E59B|nr:MULTISPECIES: MtrAB system histidine kinase MtrB [unclassified Arthrobacter]MBE0008691.1 sensor histidine kinase [Arthrobacter sp. AET 35A]NOJ58535.1 HAMP domain-containing histidine kinase [Arthrobacter sp. 260]NOJ62524.1 HAMP domain-containing histidine kinase [Arthrobacter sp. 147(2020)]